MLRLQRRRCLFFVLLGPSADTEAFVRRFRSVGQREETFLYALACRLFVGLTPGSPVRGLNIKILNMWKRFVLALPESN